LSGTPPALEAEILAWLAVQAERVIDTACAHVALTPEVAWKMKRHADLGYADFSTLDRRKWALDRELEFNRPGAPDIYRAVRRITRAVDGALALDGDGETLDYVLEMRRFDEGAVLSAIPEAVDGPLAEAMGRMIARQHVVAPLRPEGGLASLAYTVGSNARLLRDTCEGLDARRVETLVELTELELESQAARLAHRSAIGYARRCHGDLHLGNILLEGGRPVPFDCIEFDDLLSDIDVQYDLAFLLMDLVFRGRREAAARALSAWLDEAARTFREGLHDGLAALPLMLSVRAAVRAHVAAHSDDPALGRAYVEAAITHLSPPPPMLTAVGGLSGSGKSTFARHVAPALGALPGAVVLRTDEVRKRLARVGPTDPLPPAAYAPEAQALAYARMLDEARALLAAGRAVVLDATFLDHALQGRAQSLAADAGVPFRGAWMTAPLEVLEARVAARSGDASDATVEVLRVQAQRVEPPAGWLRIDATSPLAPQALVWADG
jgi:uncharacterized protein